MGCDNRSVDDATMDDATVDDFLWMEVKTGNSIPSKSQIRAKSKTSIPVKIFRVLGISDMPKSIFIKFTELEEPQNDDSFEEMKKELERFRDV